MLLRPQGHDVQIGGSPTGWGGGRGPYLTFLAGRLLLWLNFLSAGRSSCCSCISQTAGGGRAQWCLPTDEAPKARWTLRILYSEKVQPSSSCLPTKIRCSLSGRMSLGFYLWHSQWCHWAGHPGWWAFVRVFYKDLHLFVYWVAS